MTNAVIQRHNVTIETAAKQMGKSHKTVRKLLKVGKLKEGPRFGKFKSITRASLLAYMKGEEDRADEIVNALEVIQKQLQGQEELLNILTAVTKLASENMVRMAQRLDALENERT